MMLVAEAIVREGLDALAAAREQFKGTALIHVLNECFAKFEEDAKKDGIVRRVPEPPIPDKLVLLAREINAYLRKFESDPEINKDRSPDGTGLHDYYCAGAGATKASVHVTYVTYQGHSKLNKIEAQVYLRWLRAGNIGRHYEALRALEAKKS